MANPKRETLIKKLKSLRLMPEALRQPTLRDVQALELRESGMTYREIGRMFGVCNETAEDMRFGHLSNGVCVTFRRLKPPGDIPCANE